MAPTTSTGTEGEVLVDEPIPEAEPRLEAGEDDTFASFLHAVREMVHSVPPVAQQVSPEADKATRRHEEKLAKAERRSTRESRKGRRCRKRPALTAEAVAAEQRPPDIAPLVQRRVPAQPTESLIETVADAEIETAVAPVQDVATRRVRRDRRREAARAAAVPPADEEPALEVALVASASTGSEQVRRPRRSRRDRRSDPARRREHKSLAKAVAQGESADPSSEPETLAEYLVRVESQQAQRGPRRPWKIAAVTVVIAAAAALPWAVPGVPDAIAGLLPGHGGSATHVQDPPVAPPTDAVVGPVGVEQQAGPYDGVRLQAAGWPREVRVQRLHVDSEVVPISGQSGSLLPPSDPQQLGWWKEGRPVGAQYGTAVITGHTVHTGGGALDHLDQLVVGDSVRVRTDAGWIGYVVQRTQVYSTAQLARDAKEIFRLGGPGRLVLITCDDWNGESYESNAIVVATPVEDLPS